MACNESTFMREKTAAETCNFDCLTDCPAERAGKDCYYNDPDIRGDIYHFKTHELWQTAHPGLMCPEPDPTTTRCPRCYSTDVAMDDRYIWCRNCTFNETLDTTYDTDGSDYIWK